MTATAATHRPASGNRRPRSPANTMLVPVLLLAGSALGQSSEPLDLYSADSQARRTPAVTAFPEYPPDARRDRLQGETTVCFRIDEAGAIVRPKVRHSTHRVFQTAAMKAIRASMFEPLDAPELATLDEVCRVYRFRLTPVGTASAAPADPPLPAPVAANVAASPPNAVPLPQTGRESVPPRSDGAEADQSGARATLTSGSDAPQPSDHDRICRTRKRPGSLIASTVCYSQSEQLALEGTNKRAVDELGREQHWRDQSIQEAQMHNRYPRGAGLGPR